MESSNTKKLVTSGVLIVASVALLLGLTFAWFTDTVTSKGNKIEAGTLNITATAAPLDPNQSMYTIVGLNGDQPFGFGTAGNVEGDGAAAIISETAWEPGQSNAKLVTVQNDSLAAKVKLQFDVTDGGLENALWFDFVKVENGAVVGTFTQRPMSTLNALAEQQEFHIPANGSVSFILAYGMSATAGNEYQGKSYEATVNIVATQDTGEKDGFGNEQYDAAAEYPTVVSTADELTAVAATGGVVELANDVALTDGLEFAASTTLNLQGKTLTVGDGTKPIQAAKGTTLTIEGNGTINGKVYANSQFGNGSTLAINAGDNFAVNSSGDNAIYGGMGTNIVINGGTYTAEKKGDGIINFLGSSLSISDATITVGASSVMNSTGIHSSASSTILNNVTVDAGYSIAVDLNKSSGATVIKGGSFTTNKESEGFRSPTIRYQGTLDISDATITRINTGILYSPTLGSTQVEGLTYSNLTFTLANGATGEDIDYRH